MADVTVYGASDDLIEVEGDVPGCDEYNGELSQFLLTGGDRALRVRVRYDDDESGCWGIEVAPRDEDTAMLPVVISQQPRMDGEGVGYSARAVVSGVDAVVLESGWVAGRCPMCGGSLFLGRGGHVTCSTAKCPDPTAADQILCEEDDRCPYYGEDHDGRRLVIYVLPVREEER